jgi:uncharacterized protein (TIRG00374 family)
VKWVSWLLGAAVLGGVVVAALHFSEARGFVELASRARPSWMLVAAALQVGTYLAQGEVWGVVARTVGKPLPLAASLKLSLAKLFMDQALPSLGISSNVLIAKGLEHSRLPRKAAMAVVVLDMVSHNAAYVICLGAGLALASSRVQSNWIIVSTALFFTFIALIWTIGLIKLAGRRTPNALARFERFSPVHGVAQFLEDADRQLTHSPWLIAETTGAQIAVVLLDVATLFVLIRSLGATAPVVDVFVSFMVASLVKSMGFVPGGLGTFEAASVLTLKAAGLPLSTALAATMLFRGLTFWLPMLPGLWASRQVAPNVK